MKDIIERFDNYLEQIDLGFSATIIGGAALTIMGITSRFTRDVDCLDPELSKEIIEHAKKFALQNPDLGLDANNWLNNGPISLKRDLPEGWSSRIQQIYKGKSIALYTLGREDLLKSKLYACCDRGIDYDDCIKLRPSKEELSSSLPWVLKGDLNPEWGHHVKHVFASLAKDLGYE